MAADQEQGQVVEAEESASSGESGENESGFNMNALLRRAAGFIGLGSDDPDDREAEDSEGDDEKPAEPEKVTLTADELEKRIQAETDRREAKRAREREQSDTAGRTAAEWERVKKLADEGDVWALGEIAKKEVDDRRQREQEDARFAETFARTAPTWDATYLDPLLSKLPEDVWKPIVGDGLTTLEQRQEAVSKALAAHREAAVAEALGDEKFVRTLLGSPSFRAAWLKSDVVRSQFLAHLRGGEDFEEPEHVPGLDRGSLPANENEDMNARFRNAGLAVVTGRSSRRRERGNRDLIE